MFYTIQGTSANERTGSRAFTLDSFGAAPALRDNFPEPHVGEGPGRFNIVAEPTPEKLQRLAELLDTGALRVPIERSYQLEQAGEALHQLPTTHSQGKISLTIA